MTTIMAPGSVPGQTPINPQQSLIGQQFAPQNSATTSWAQGYTQALGNQYASTGFTPFQTQAPLNLGASQQGLTQANNAMQGLSLNYGGANTQYGAAQRGLGAAATQAGQQLGALQGMNAATFTGGGANTADFGASTGLINRAMDTTGAPFSYGSDTGMARGMVTPALQAAMTGPERGQIAAESLALLEQRSQPGFERSLRGVMERNAAMGRRGSGITTNELGDVSLARERELALARRDLANEAASRTLQDRMDRANLAMGVTQGLGAEDRGAAGMRLNQAGTLLSGAGQLANQSQFNANQQENAARRAAEGAQFNATFQRGLVGDRYGMGRDQANLAMGIGDRYSGQEESRVGLGERQAGFGRNVALDAAGLTRDQYQAGVNERDAARRDEFDRANFTRTRFNDFQGALRDNWAQDANLRNEMRGERAWQYGLSRDAMNDEYRRMDWEEALRQNRYNRALGTTNLGFGASPGSAYANAAGAAGDRAGDYYDAFTQWMQQFGNRTGNRTGAPAVNPNNYQSTR